MVHVRANRYLDMIKKYSITVKFKRSYTKLWIGTVPIKDTYFLKWLVFI